MLRTLRSRLVLSHILPLIIVVPIMYLAQVYIFETRFLVPRLTADALDNARYLTAVAQAQYLLQGDPNGFGDTLARLEFRPGMRVIYLGPNSKLLYTNDPDYLKRINMAVIGSSLARAWAGDQIILTHYTILSQRDDIVQVMAPVHDTQQQVIGVLWITYYAASINELFQQLRFMSIGAMAGFLALGALLGLILAVSISRPVHKVTGAIHNLALGEANEKLSEQGSEEIRDLIRAVNYLVDRLKNLEQARRQLLANLVHELGRPLGALRSAIQALAGGAANDPQLLKDLTDGMDEETARLQHILDDLAHLHEIGLGSLELNCEPVNLGEWLPKVLVPWQEAAFEKRLKWQADIPGDLPTVQADPVRLAQVIGNLLSNAVKYTPIGREVDVAAGTQDGEVWIKVSDTGPGISKEEQQDIFRPFFRGAQGKRIKQGMGLGLSIARDLTQAHNGRLEVDSTPGFGTTFTVRLPLS